MTDTMRVVLEFGPKGKRVAAVAPDWPGLSRGAKTEEEALEVLAEYLPRYAGVAERAAMGAEFNTGATLDVVERYQGTGSTDFWGISFAHSDIDRQEMSGDDLDRRLALMQACWMYFDDVRSRVSAELQKGPRGGGRDRDQIVRHILANEQQEWGKKLGLEVPAGVIDSEDGIGAHREAYVDAIRRYHAEGKMARTWPLSFLIRHTAFHTMDHAWEMEDKDLNGKATS